MRIDAVERCLQRITEAAIKVGPEAIAEIAPHVPLDKLRGLGNPLRHAYDLMDAVTIWHRVINDLPSLRDSCAAALAGDRQ